MKSIFFLSISLIYVLIHLYIYLKAKKVIPDVNTWKNSLRAGLILLCLSFFIGETFEKQTSSSIFSQLGANWFGFVIHLFPVLLIRDLIHLFIRKYYKTTFLIAIILVTTGSLYSVAKNFYSPVVKHVRLNSLKKSLPDNYKIIHLTDLHLGNMKSEAWLQDIVGKCNREKPDLILITGDLINNSYRNLVKYIPLLKELATTDGVFAVSGNHDFHDGIETFEKFCIESGIIPIRNKMLQIENRIQLIGIDDPRKKIYGENPITISSFKKPILKDIYSIFLFHRPEQFEEAANIGIDLQLSGHTHRGQIFIGELIIPFIYKYYYGLYKLNNSYLYTSSGTGTWGPFMRGFSNSEIVVITIKR